MIGIIWSIICIVMVLKVVKWAFKSVCGDIFTSWIWYKRGQKSVNKKDDN